MSIDERDYVVRQMAISVIVTLSIDSLSDYHHVSWSCLCLSNVIIDYACDFQGVN